MGLQWCRAVCTCYTWYEPLVNFAHFRILILCFYCCAAILFFGLVLANATVTYKTRLLIDWSFLLYILLMVLAIALEFRRMLLTLLLLLLVFCGLKKKKSFVIQPLLSYQFNPLRWKLIICHILFQYPGGNLKHLILEQKRKRLQNIIVFVNRTIKSTFHTNKRIHSEDCCLM